MSSTVARSLPLSLFPSLRLPSRACVHAGQCLLLLCSNGSLVFQENWTTMACPHIRKRISRYSQSEIRFNLLAIVRNQPEALQEQLQEIDAAAARQACAMDTGVGASASENAEPCGDATASADLKSTRLM